MKTRLNLSGWPPPLFSPSALLSRFSQNVLCSYPRMSFKSLHHKKLCGQMVGLGTGEKRRENRMREGGRSWRQMLKNSEKYAQFSQWHPLDTINKNKKREFCLAFDLQPCNNVISLCVSWMYGEQRHFFSFFARQKTVKQTGLKLYKQSPADCK